MKALDIKPIPETIQQIVKQGVSLCDDWQDLIEYMMNYYRFKMKTEESSKGMTMDWLMYDIEFFLQYNILFEKHVQ